MASSYSAPDAAHDYVLGEVRAADRDRFLAALFASEPQRRGLLTLLAFDHELARTRAVTREPMLARIRLEWWREAVAEAAGDGQPRAQPIVEALSETVRHYRLPDREFANLIDAREEEIEGALDVVRAGHALADLQLAVLGVTHEPTRTAARAVGAAWLMGEGPEREALLAEARSHRAGIDMRALPILLPARLLDRQWTAWQKPLVLWWAAQRRRF
ncbi:MAG: squalene/phytoene synthase family protein [Enhydrobacter sp.]|nr:squalene/phytoene synthase family protein [Enhydrobacter sp.]